MKSAILLLVIVLAGCVFAVTIRYRASKASEHAFVLQMDYMSDKFELDDAELSNDRAEYLAHASDANAFRLMSDGTAMEKDMKETLKVYHEHFPKPSPTDAERYRTP